MDEFHSVISAFQARFGSSPDVVARAPGRVNLIGEHTDYNDGFVLPFAIDRAVEVAAGPAAPGFVTVHSAVMNETVTFPTEVSQPATDVRWQNYLRGVVFELRRRDLLVDGAALWIGGDLSPGCGLSSSAALCVASTLALKRLVHTELGALDVVKLAQFAEHKFVGTPCGIMDPYVSVFGRSGQGLLLDCRSITHEYVSLELPGYEFVVVQSGVKHELSQGAYDQRVRECQTAVTAIAAVDPTVRALRDVNLDLLQRHAERLVPVIAKRARHVVTENQRVHEAVAALRSGRIPDLGQCLFDSHGSLRDDYEVSCPEIDGLMSLLQDHHGVLGARMFGGGFGGAILALVHKNALPTLAATIAETYTRTDCKPPEMFTVRPSQGAECRPL